MKRKNFQNKFKSMYCKKIQIYIKLYTNFIYSLKEEVQAKDTELQRLARQKN